MSNTYIHKDPKKSYRIRVSYIVDDRVGYSLINKNGDVLKDKDGNEEKWKQFSKKYFEENYRAIKI